MRWRDLGAIVALVSGVSAAERAEGSSQTVYVNCGAAPGGDGSALVAGVLHLFMSRR
jgi:hypothetical protein